MVTFVFAVSQIQPPFARMESPLKACLPWSTEILAAIPYKPICLNEPGRHSHILVRMRTCTLNIVVDMYHQAALAAVYVLSL